MRTLLSILTLILSFNLSYGTFRYKNKPLFETSGIFYDNLGKSRISNSKLTLLAHLNISYLEDGKTILSRQLGATLALCAQSITQTSTDFHCNRTVAVIKDELDALNLKHEILEQLTKHKSRQRRGLFNGVSNALNWLFGVPDADDAQYYSDSINSLLGNNKQTQTLLKAQIQIISSTIKNFNESVFSLKKQEDIMNKNTARINEFMSKTGDRLSKVELESVVLEQISILTSLASRLSREYNQYIDAVNLGKHNIVSPAIVTPKVLLEELTKYKGKYDLLVEPISENVPLLYNLINLQVLYLDETVIFALRLPLVRKAIYDLYRLIPLPIQHSNTTYFSYINPRHEYLLVSLSKTHHSFMRDLSGCNEYKEGSYVCFHLHTSQTADQPGCEVQLLSPHIKQIPSDCDISTIKAKIETWKYISHNKWVYVLQEPATLTLLCSDEDNHMEDIILDRTGLLELSRNCMGYTGLYALEPMDYASKNRTYYVPSVSLLEQDCCIDIPNSKDQKTESLQPVQLSNVDLSDLTYASKKLKEFDTIITKQINEPFIVTHTRWYTIAIGIIAAIIFFLVLYQCCYHCRCLYLLKRLCCYTRNPTNGEIMPPVIKNFVNCTFDSDMRTEYRDNTRDHQVIYSRRSIRNPDTDSPGSSIDGQEDVPSTLAYFPRRNLKSRRSTTPL